MDWARKWFVDFNATKSPLVLFDWSNNTGAINTVVTMDGSVFEGKTSNKMLGLSFSSKLDWCPYIITSIRKTASRKIGVLIRSLKFFSPEVALYLCKSNMQPCIEYYCHTCAGVTCWYFEVLDKLQKGVCRTGGL